MAAARRPSRVDGAGGDGPAAAAGPRVPEGGRIPPPRFERPDRGRSPVYLANLATHCARRGRPGLGLRLFDRALGLAADWAKPDLERRRAELSALHDRRLRAAG
ncbi:hypothetical protein [Falsiroseomonas sp. E2-1-a20]|uniref:hypothetical protein n=1 Tax=Falsiroseomonas sp. E2-1-a20 TaxID=3239300 RepID=UPI003F382888